MRVWKLFCALSCPINCAFHWAESTRRHFCSESARHVRNRIRVSNTQNIDQKSTQDNSQMIVISSAITQGNLSPNLRRRMSRDQQVLDRMFDQPCQRAHSKPCRLAAPAKLCFIRCLRPGGAIALQLSVSAPMGDEAGRFAQYSASWAWARPSSNCKKKGEFIGRRDR
jgi:hypothetical protein